MGYGAKRVLSVQGSKVEDPKARVEGLGPHPPGSMG